MAHTGEVFEGRTLDAAVRNGLEALGLSRAEVMITILEEGASGFLGIGARPYRVRVMRRPGGPPAVEPDAESRRRRSAGRERREREHGRGERRERPHERDERREALRGERRPEPREERLGERREPRAGEERRERARDRGERRPEPREERLGERREPRGGEERRERARERDERREAFRGERRLERPEEIRRPREDRGEPAAAPEPFPPEAGEVREEMAAGTDEGRRRRRGRRGGRRRHGGAAESRGEAGFAREGRPEERVSGVPEISAPRSGPAAEEESPALREPDRRALREEPRPDRERGPALSAEQLAAQSTRLTETLLQAMGFEAKVGATVDGDHVEVTAEVAQDDELLTGRKGEVRQALQHLLNRMLNRGESSRYHLQLEINDFWKRREEELRDLARALAEEAVASDGETVTEYLNAQERRIVHVTLREDPRVKTYALGTGMIKRVAIAPAAFEGGPRDEDA